MDLGLEGRVYVVTGASRGLGFAAAQALVADGARVAICSRDEDALRAAADRLGGSDHALAVPGDIGDPSTTARLVAASMAKYGRLDGVLVSVGGPPTGTVVGLADEQWRSAFDSVFLGPLHMARAAAHEMGDEGGSIAFVLSTSVKSPIEGLALSNAFRPALAMTAKTMADELGARHIRVNGLLPGRIDTERLRELESSGGRPVSSRREWERQIPLGRYGAAEEFGKVAAFVLSPAASYVNGTMVAVDGGLLRTF
jgi:3-oxoacyl-[acyl-carrier protein] reductase